MKKTTKFLLFFLLLILTCKLPLAQASFSAAYLRLTNQTANSPIVGTACAKPASTGTEAKVTIKFPNSFTISSNPNKWDTNFNNLPSGSVAWPGIENLSVSGKSVTFVSSDLTTGTLYCFNFSGASSTTGTTGPDQTGIIETKNSANATIDSTTYAVSILTNNQVTVRATAPMQISDLPIEIDAQTKGNNFPQDTILSYKITYGSLASSSFPLKIQAHWSQGTIEDSLTPSVDILDYVIGSASNAYNATPAVIDTVSNTLTWTISSFPANTLNKTVTFRLRTNDSYTGYSNVAFDVIARSISGSTITPDQTTTQTYLYRSVPATPTPQPTATPTPAPSSSSESSTTTVAATPTPLPTTKPPSFSAINVETLSQSQAQIAIDVNSNSTFTIKYGNSLDSLFENIISLTPLTANSITIPDLIPDTNYYFKVIAKDTSGKTTSSDTFTFKTASVSESPNIDKQSLLATSNDNVLVNPSTAAGEKQPAGNTITVPTSSTFDLRFSLKKYIAVKNMQAIVRNRVLGESTFFPAVAEASTNYITLVEVSPSVYSGRFKSLPNPGSYEIFIRIVDYNGNISEQKLADLTITPKLTVYDNKTKKGIENVRALFYLYNEKAKTYDLISPQLLPIRNPDYSEVSGEYEVVLPYGKYRVDLSAIAYDSKTIEFAVTSRGGYPKVYLEPDFNPLNTIQYYISTLRDTIIAGQMYFQQQAKSSRLFDLSMVGAVIFLIGITILSISARTHITVFYLPYFLFFKLSLLFRKDKSRIIFGKIIDEKTESPISRANVYLSTPNGEHVLLGLKTNKLGEFYYNNTKGLDYKITVIKEGYSSPEPWEFVNNKVKAIPTMIRMKLLGKPRLSIPTVILLYIEDLLGMCMESLILFGLLIQIYSIFTFGLVKVAPFILITIVNVTLIITYLYKPRNLQH